MKVFTIYIKEKSVPAVKAQPDQQTSLIKEAAQSVTRVWSIAKVDSKVVIEDSFANTICVEEKFSLIACLFAPIWALYHRMWTMLFTLMAFYVVMHYITMENAQYAGLFKAIGIGVSLYVGFTANEWRQRSLEAKGYKFCEVIVADNEDEALFRFLSNGEA